MSRYVDRVVQVRYDDDALQGDEQNLLEQMIMDFFIERDQDVLLSCQTDVYEDD